MNNRNLQKELDTIITNSEASGIRPKLLLHVCCAPCSSYCLEYLRQYFDITVLYANSNIDDAVEYELRRDESRRLVSELKEKEPDAAGKPLEEELRWIEGLYDPEKFHALVKGHEKDDEGARRCDICFKMRLEEAAEYAARNHFDYFTTSLSISPLKDAQKLCIIGEMAAERFGTKYLPSDFKKKGGYQRSIELSKEHNLYRQNYCGCSFSKVKAGGN